MHKMTDHKTVEEVLKNSIIWEDTDTFIVIGLDERKNILVSEYWSMEEIQAPTLLQGLYKVNSHCYCDENE